MDDTLDKSKSMGFVQLNTMAMFQCCWSELAKLSAKMRFLADKEGYLNTIGCNLNPSENQLSVDLEETRDIFG